MSISQLAHLILKFICLSTVGTSAHSTWPPTITFSPIPHSIAWPRIAPLLSSGVSKYVFPSYNSYVLIRCKNRYYRLLYIYSISPFVNLGHEACTGTQGLLRKIPFRRLVPDLQRFRIWTAVWDFAPGIPLQNVYTVGYLGLLNISVKLFLLR